MSSATPCAGCRFRRQKCNPDCIFAPYFPPEDIQKFANCHKVFGTSNITKILNDLDPAHRVNAVRSLVYQAEARLQNPIYGSVGYISLLQKRLKQVQTELFSAKNELSMYIGPSAMLPNLNQENPAQLAAMYNIQPMLDVPGPGHGSQLVIREPQYNQPQQHQQMLEAQKLSAVLVAREQEEIMMRSYGQHQLQLQQQQQHQNHSSLQQQHQLQQTGIDGLIDGLGSTMDAGQVTASGFSDLTGEDMLPLLALGSYNNSMYNAQQQQQQQQQQKQKQQQQQQQQSEIEGLIDGNTRDDGQVTASAFMDITEQDMLSSLDFGPYKNSMYHTYQQQQQQQQQSEIEGLVDGFDNTRNAEQVTASGLIDCTEEDMLSSLDLGSYNNIMYDMLQQQQQQQQEQSEIKCLIDGFQNMRNAEQVSASGLELTEHDKLQLLVLGSYNDSMYTMNQQQQQPQSEIEGLIDGYHNTRDAGQVSASGFEVTEEDMLQSLALDSYNYNVYPTHNQQQQYQQIQHQLQLQVDPLLLQQPEQPQLPDRNGVEEGGYRGRPPI